MSEKTEVAKNSFSQVSPEQVRERTQQSSDFRTAYFNHARIVPSFYDVRIFFGQSSITPKGEQTFEEQLCVILAPECTKTIAENLLTAMQKYEEIFGEIRPVPVLPGSPTQNAPGMVKQKKK